MIGYRIGNGYDVHRFAPDRKLILGGVDIPHTQGLAGHSDADVLCHAVMDALLGAAALGDIGKHFPDTDPDTEGISSLVLLRQVKELLCEKSFRIINLDTILVAQEPRLSPYIDGMRDNIASCLDIPLSCVNVKATTEEGLGFTGARLGMAAYAVCLIHSV